MAQVNPFETLGMPLRFELPMAEVRAAWLRRSADLHPDRAVGGVDEGEASRAAAALNEAKRTLEDDERRADALLVLLGGPTREAVKDLPDGFLMEVMEIREGLAEAMEEGDAARVEELKSWAESRRSEHIAHVASAFKGLGETPDAESLRAIRVEMNAWRYIERMLEQLDAPAGGAAG